MKDTRKFATIFAAFAVGVSSIIFQTAAIREFMSVFFGTELIYGIVFANWTLATALGALLGVVAVKRKPRFKIVPLQFAAAVLPIASIYALRFLRYYFFEQGEQVGPGDSAWFSLAVIAPYCLISGALFTAFASALADFYQKASGKTYLIDSLGMFVGGAAFFFVFARSGATFESLIAAGLINLLAVCVSTFLDSKKITFVFSALTASILILAGFAGTDRIGLNALFPGEDIIERIETKYSALTVTERAGQKNFYENGIFFFSESDRKIDEEKAHFALGQRTRIENVFVAGFSPGVVREIAKHNPKHIEIWEPDSRKVELIERNFDYGSPSEAEIVIADPRKIKPHDKLFDAAIIDVGYPANAKLNRFYTVEFFRSIKKRLTPDGLIELSLPGVSRYVGEESSGMYSAVYAALDEVFDRIEIVPGSNNYFLASDSTLSLDFLDNLKAKNVSAEFVNEFYVDRTSLLFSADAARAGIDESAEPNRDFKPAAYYQYVVFVSSYYDFSGYVFVLIYLVPAIFAFRGARQIDFAVASAGFSVAAAQTILIVGYQIVAGAVYEALALLVAVFTGGLAVGSGLYFLVFSRKGSCRPFPGLITAQILLSTFALLLPLFLRSASGSGSNIFASTASFAAIAAAISIVSGFHFAAASELRAGTESEKAGSLFGADLIGAAWGGVLSAAWAIPLLGIGTTSAIAAAVCLAGTTFVFFGYRS